MAQTTKVKTGSVQAEIRFIAGIGMCLCVDGKPLKGQIKTSINQYPQDFTKASFDFVVGDSALKVVGHE